MRYRGMIVALTGLMALLVSGCVNTDQTLTKDGHTVNCNTVGWGLIGAPIAYASYRHCVDFYLSQGYLDPAAQLAKVNGTVATQ